MPWATTTEVVVCKAFPRAFLALVFPLAVENSVFFQGHLARIILVTLGAFEGFFGIRLDLKLFEAVGSQVSSNQLLDLLRQYVAMEGTQLTTHGIFREVIQIVEFELGAVVKYLTAVFAHERRRGMVLPNLFSCTGLQHGFPAYLT